MQQRAAMRILRDLLTDADVVVLGIGSANVDWFALGQRALDFGIYAAMGLAQSFGLGLALAQPQRRVLVLEGDGGVLMSMGAIASAAEQAPPNLKHFVFINRGFGATGNQPLPAAGRLDFVAAARALGAPSVGATTPEEFRAVAAQALATPGYVVVYVETDPGQLRDFIPGEMRVPLPLEQRARFLHAIGLEA